MAISCSTARGCPLMGSVGLVPRCFSIRRFSNTAPDTGDTTGSVGTSPETVLSQPRGTVLPKWGKRLRQEIATLSYALPDLSGWMSCVWVNFGYGKQTAAWARAEVWQASPRSQLHARTSPSTNIRPMLPKPTAKSAPRWPHFSLCGSKTHSHRRPPSWTTETGFTCGCHPCHFSPTSWSDKRCVSPLLVSS
jgi:hypothetical protein